MKWKDTSSYSRGQMDRTPREFTLKLPFGRLVLHRLHGCEGWFTSLHGVEWDASAVEGAMSDEACAAALDLALSRMKEIVAALESAKEPTP